MPRWPGTKMPDFPEFHGKILSVNGGSSAEPTPPPSPQAKCSVVYGLFSYYRPGWGGWGRGCVTLLIQISVLFRHFSNPVYNKDYDALFSTGKKHEDISCFVFYLEGWRLFLKLRST